MMADVDNCRRMVSEWFELAIIMIKLQDTNMYSYITLCTHCNSSLLLGRTGLALIYTTEFLYYHRSHQMSILFEIVAANIKLDSVWNW